MNKYCLITNSINIFKYFHISTQTHKHIYSYRYVRECVIRSFGKRFVSRDFLKYEEFCQC